MTLFIRFSRDDQKYITDQFMKISNVDILSHTRKPVHFMTDIFNVLLRNDVELQNGLGRTLFEFSLSVYHCFTFIISLAVFIVCSHLGLPNINSSQSSSFIWPEIFFCCKGGSFHSEFTLMQKEKKLRT